MKDALRPWNDMAPRSSSRGFLYSSPPTETDDADEETARERDEPTNDVATRDESPTLAEGAARGTTDANWTGDVPADD